MCLPLFGCVLVENRRYQVYMIQIIIISAVQLFIFFRLKLSPFPLLLFLFYPSSTPPPSTPAALVSLPQYFFLLFASPPLTNRNHKTDALAPHKFVNYDQIWQPYWFARIILLAAFPNKYKRSTQVTGMYACVKAVVLSPHMRDFFYIIVRKRHARVSGVNSLCHQYISCLLAHGNPYKGRCCICSSLQKFVYLSKLSPTDVSTA